MYWGLYFLPSLVPSTFSFAQLQPYQLSTNQQMPITANGSVAEKKSQEKGLQINLTPKELLQAGYQTNKKPWTEDQDIRLMSICKNEGLSWKQIADGMPGRTAKMCYSRYRRIESQTKKLWSVEEDSKIKELVVLWGFDWMKICEQFPKRTPKQLEDHYNNYLRPGINKDPWTYEEDLLLLNMMKVYGKDWNSIEGKFKGRTHNQIKNRYYGRLKRIEDKKIKAKKNKRHEIS